MKNAVLKSLSVENFVSYADRTSFTTEIDGSKKEYLDTVFPCGDSRFNKVSFLYGANGTGKTFFCKIIREIQRLLDWSPMTAINNNQLLSLPHLRGIDAPVRVFAFDLDYQDKPTTFAIEIIIDGTTYHYEFDIRGRVVERELLTKKYRRTEKLLERTSPSFRDIALHSELRDFEMTKQVVKEEALCLPVAAMLNNPLALKIVNAIKSIQVINMTAARIQPTNTRASFSDERLQKYTSILKKADPTIRHMAVEFEEKEIARQKIENDDFENREIIATKTTVGVETQHAVFVDGKEQWQSPIAFFADESLGTIKLFTAMPYIFDILETGGVLVIDELENGLHLSLAKEIINLFTSEETNPLHAQLICTSHQPLLIADHVRRDQVWITAKDRYGKSSLHRLSKSGMPRDSKSLWKRILDGAFGCSPELFFDNIT